MISTFNLSINITLFNLAFLYSFDILILSKQVMYMKIKKVNLKLSEGEQSVTVEVVLDFTNRCDPTLYRSEHDGGYLFIHTFKNLDGTFDSYWKCLEEALTNGLNPNLVENTLQYI